jgi:heme/copper-type cytochrome/quinol oxidase subunit 2
MKYVNIKILIIGTLLTPFVAEAFGYKSNPLKSMLIDAFNIVGKSIPIVFGLALLFFFYGVAKFVLHAGDEKKIEEGRNLMIWGTIAMFVLVSVYGLIKFIGGNLGISAGNITDTVKKLQP